MNVLDLFSGIGGFSLGLERAGMRTVAFCEIEPYQRAVLRKHWPDVPCYHDVRNVKGTADRTVGDASLPPFRTNVVGPIDVICGGFPCQDISVAGKRAGIEGERSGLWKEYARLIGELRPRYVIVENVSALLNRGLDVVLGDLAAFGYDAEWHCIPASAVGAPHRRDRIWVVAYPNCNGIRQQSIGQQGSSDPAFSIADGPEECVADPTSERRRERRPGRPSGIYKGLRDAASSLADARRQSAQIPIAGQLAAIQVAERNPWWATEPDVGRVAHGVSDRMDRLRALGNSVVPQIPEIIGRAIMSLKPKNSELLPCPFCGSENVEQFVPGGHFWCRSCQSTAPTREKWNARASMLSSPNGATHDRA